MFKEYLQYDGLGLAELVRQKAVHPRELVDAAIHHIEKNNPRLNAVVYKCYEEAKQQAEQNFSDTQLFAGVPFLLKNLELALRGQPMNFGSRLVGNYIPDYDSELTTRFKKAGVIILGRTNAPEFGTDFHTEPDVFGATHNVWQNDLTAGGSSGGAGVAVASGMVPLAHAGDGGGSIRIPASCSGVFGLKPSRGRVPLGPDMGKGWQGLIIDHVISRSVRDSAAMLDCVAGADVGAAFLAPTHTNSFLDACVVPTKPLRIAVIKQPLFQAKSVHHDCLDAVNKAAILCESLGHHIDEVSPFIDAQQLANDFLILVASETSVLIEDLAVLVGKKVHHHEVQLVNRFMMKLGKSFSAKEFVAVTHYLDDATRKVAQFFQNYDIILTPTLATPPGKIGSYAPSRIEQLILSMACRVPYKPLLRAIFNQFKGEAFDFSPFTPLFNISGSPAMSMPLHWNEKQLPIGIQFVADVGNEATLFNLATQLEQASPWATKYNF